jgi:hypothetical protein
LKRAANSYTGLVYQHYEKILYLFDRKAYEDIYQTLKKMESGHSIRRREEYYLFYRIFAFSFFEVNYPFSFNLTLTEAERISTQNRFLYISAFMNRLLLKEETIVLSREFFTQTLGKTVKNFIAFGVFLYILGFLLKLFFSLAFQMDILREISEGGRAFTESLFNSLLSFNTAGTGIFSVVLAAGGLLLLIYLVYVLYKLTMNFLGWMIRSLKEKHILFFIFFNCLMFFIAFNMVTDIASLAYSATQKEEVLLVTNESDNELLRRDNFITRFLDYQGIGSRYNLREVPLTRLRDELSRIQAKDTLPASGYSKIIVHIVPDYIGALSDDYQKVLSFLFTLWRDSERDRNCEIVFLDPFTVQRPDFFRDLPYLDRMELKYCFNPDIGDYGTAYIADTVPGRSGAQLENKFYKGLKDLNKLQEFFKSLEGKELKKLTPEERRELNIGYYYQFTNADQARFKAIAREILPALFSPLTKVHYPTPGGKDEEAVGSFLYSYSDAQGLFSPPLKNRGRFAVLALDQKYLRMDSGFGDYAKNEFFTPAAGPDPAHDELNRNLYLGLHGLLVLLIAALGGMMTYLNRPGKVALAASLLLTALFGSAVFLGSAAPLPALFFANAVNIAVYLALGWIFAFYLCQLIGLQRNYTLLVLAVLVPVASLTHLVVGALVPATVADLYGFLIKTLPGALLQCGLLACIGIVSYVFFSFRFKVK